MRDRSQKVREVLEPGREIPMKSARRLELVGAEQRSQEGVPQDARQMWKELFLEAMFFQALLETDKEKLTEMLQGAERVMVLRAQELLNSSDHREERGEMDTALAALLSIKIHKLGWPAESARDGLS
jgi:hypothetical protein